MRPPLQLTLLRHGRSRADDEGVHEGRYDAPLTAVGLDQARRLADYWQEHPPGFQRVLCSSLRRARATAEIVAGALGLEPEVSELWREFDNGPLAGLSFEEAGRRYPTPAYRGRFDPYTCEGGESRASMQRRISLALEELMQSGSERVLVVAHGGSLNHALQELLGLQNGFCAFGDTGFARLVVSRDRDETVLLDVNRRPHLETRVGERADELLGS